MFISICVPWELNPCLYNAVDFPHKVRIDLEVCKVFKACQTLVSNIAIGDRFYVNRCVSIIVSIIFCLNPGSLCLMSPGGSESSWDKEKLQSPPSSGGQHSLAHLGLSAHHGLSGSHLSSLQQTHLLANRESFIHHLHVITSSRCIYSAPFH